VHLDRVNVSDDLFVTTDTGRVSLDTVTALNVILESSTGSVIVDELTGTALTATSDTGTIEVKNSEITNQVDLDTDTGAVKVYHTTASGYDLSSSTGTVSVTLTSLLDIKFDLQTSLGDINIDGENQGTRHTTSIGSILLKARVSTGNISIQVLD